MNINLGKTSHILFFIVFLPAVSFGAGWAFATTFPRLPFWMEGISPLGAYAVLYSLFERYAWHWPIFRTLGIVEIPDLRGRWEGEQLSSFKSANGKPVRSHMVLEVEQTFSAVHTKAYYCRWTDAHSASCFLQIEGKLYLVIIFESEPGPRSIAPVSANKGVARLEYIAADKLIVGTYFNTLGNKGELELQRTSRALLHRFMP